MLARTVTEAARAHGDRTALVTSAGLSVTYRQLGVAVGEVAGGLAERGVGDGSTVLLSLPSGSDYVAVYAAADHLGAATAGVNPRLTARERAGIAAAVAPDLVVTTATRAAGLPPEVPTVECDPAADGGRVAAGLRSAGPVPPAAPPDPERPVCICFTSGSTGDPKGAWFAERQLAAVARFDTDGAWGGVGHTIAATAMAHVGFMTKLPWQLAAGVTIHVLDRWNAAEVLDLVVRHRMPAVTGVAAQIALMLAHPGFDDLDLSAVQAIVVGGGPSPPAMVDEARRRFGAPYSIRYSSTESGGVGLGTALDADDEEALHTIGRPRPGVEAEVRGDDGELLIDGGVGELWLRTPTAMSGYWLDPEGSAATLVDGWLRTGDLAQIDERGCFRLAGRVKEMYIRGGYNVYPQEVEAVIGTHPAVAQVAVVPRSDPVMGEVGVAVVVPVDPRNPPDLDDLRRHGRGGLSGYKLPEAVRIVDALPLNSGDKLDRRRLTDESA